MDIAVHVVPAAVFTAEESVLTQGLGHTVDRIACFKGYFTGLVGCGAVLGGENFKAFPLHGFRPFLHVFMIGLVTDARMHRFVEVIILAEGVGGIARTHERFGGGGGFTAFDIGFAAFFVGAAGAAGTQGHGVPPG